MADAKMAERLRWARERAGISSAAAAARRLAMPYPTYYDYEAGKRGFAKLCPFFATAFRVRPEWLLTGRGLPRDEMEAVLVKGMVDEFGVIGELSEIKKMPDNVKDFETHPPEVGEFTAYRVSGGFNLPTFEGDVIYAGPPDEPEKLIGKRCVAHLADGTRRIGILFRGSAAGLFMLMTVGGGAPAIQDVEVYSAAPIVWIRAG